MNDLPDEVVASVLAKLSPSRQQLIAAPVNRRWRKAILAPYGGVMSKWLFRARMQVSLFVVLCQFKNLKNF